MKSINTYITEALRIKSGTKIATGPKYKYHPKTKRELQDLIKQLIKERGIKGDFNDIDTSQITDMSYLFFDMSLFNGDISKWDVSNVEKMQQMFRGCNSFNQDISNWDVSNVTDNFEMFSHCIINEKHKPKFKK